MTTPAASRDAASKLFNIEAEAALLGALLIEPTLIPAIAEFLAEQHFYEPLHGRIFAVASRLSAEGKPVNPVLLKPFFENDFALQELGGITYLARLTAEGKGLGVVAELAEQIYDYAARRRFSAAITDPDQPIDTIAADLAKAAESTHRSACAALPFGFAGDVQPVLDGLWLIDGWLPKSGIGVVYGHPGSGKTFLALDMATAIASGREWAGRHVERGAVVYVIAEGHVGFGNRLAAIIEDGRLDRTAPFAFVPTTIDLQSPDGDTGKLIATVHHIVGKLAVPAALIVIDTLSKTFGGGKENTDDMAAYVANCQRIATAFACCTLILHHRPKDAASNDIRGHSSLRGGIDTAILVEGGDTKTAAKTATTIKQRDGDDNERVSFELERFPLGIDSRGNEVSTCLVNISENSARKPASIADPLTCAKPGLKGHAKTALRIIEQTIQQYGEDPPRDIPPDKIDRRKIARAVQASTCRNTFKFELTAVIDDEGDINGDTIKRTFNRVLEKLKAAGILGSWGEWLWVN